MKTPKKGICCSCQCIQEVRVVDGTLVISDHSFFEQDTSCPGVGTEPQVLIDLDPDANSIGWEI